MADAYYFDEEAAGRAVEFFSRFLRLTTAEWARKTFVLNAEQIRHTRQIFGWKRRDNGMRRYRRVRCFMPKKNWKTEWAAGLAHLMAVGDGEPGAEVYFYATNKAQAEIGFGKASRMVALDIEETGQPGKLGELYEVTKRGLFCPHLMATIQPISGDPTGKHGPSPHCSIGDEVHEWPNGALHRFMVEGMASRRQPLDVLISTAGEIRTYAEEEYENAKAVLADPSLDPEMYVIVYEADEGDDWRDPATWAKANPNYPVSPKHEFLESLCRQAQRNPRLENDFKRYHLGIWVEQAKRWFQMDRWRDNTAAPADLELWQKLVAQLAGRRAFGGTDLASTDDVTAHCWVFPPVEAGERTKLIWRFWCPAATIEERDQPRRPYRRWRDMGALIETPGNVTDYDFIEEQIEADAELFQIKRGNPDIHEIAIDRWNATQVAVHLGNDGFNVALFGQGFASMAAPSKEMERLFIDGALEHGNNPIARWMFGNAAYRKDPAGNIKPDKEKARDKIDGVVAAIMGLGLSMGCRGEPDLDQWLANPLAVEA